MCSVAMSVTMSMRVIMSVMMVMMGTSAAGCRSRCHAGILLKLLGTSNMQ